LGADRLQPKAGHEKAYPDRRSPRLVQTIPDSWQLQVLVVGVSSQRVTPASIDRSFEVITADTTTIVLRCPLPTRRESTIPKSPRIPSSLPRGPSHSSQIRPNDGVRLRKAAARSVGRAGLEPATDGL
jgi:hypothetical protein